MAVRVCANRRTRGETGWDLFLSEKGLLCKTCCEAKVASEFSEGKVWTKWKLYYLKRHIQQKSHLNAVGTVWRCKMAMLSSDDTSVMLGNSTFDSILLFDTAVKQEASSSTPQHHWPSSSVCWVWWHRLLSVSCPSTQQQTEKHWPPVMGYSIPFTESSLYETLTKVNQVFESLELLTQSATHSWVSQSFF